MGVSPSKFQNSKQKKEKAIKIVWNIKTELKEIKLSKQYGTSMSLYQKSVDARCLGANTRQKNWFTTHSRHNA